MTDEDRPLELELPDHRVQVRDEVAHGVGARLVAVAVSAQVEGHHVVAGAERLGQRLERESEVLDAVHQDQRASALVAVVVAAQLDAGAVERERPGSGGWAWNGHRPF